MSNRTFDNTYPLAESFAELLRQSDFAKTRDQLIVRIEEISNMDNLSLEEKEQLINQCFEDMGAVHHRMKRQSEEIFNGYRIFLAQRESK